MRLSGKTGKICAPISQLRFSENYRMVKAAVDRGDFGKILLWLLSMKYYRSPEYYGASLVFQNGTLGVIDASTAIAHAKPRRLELCGTKASVTLEEDVIVSAEGLELNTYRNATISRITSTLHSAEQKAELIRYAPQWREISSSITTKEVPRSAVR